MGDTARADDDVPSFCEKCGQPCELERTVDGARESTRLRCLTCSHVVEIAVFVRVAAAPGKWTVVDADGVACQFSSWEELTASRPGAESAPRSTRTASAAALLDVTPSVPPVAAASSSPSSPPRSRAPVTEPAGRLSLVPGDDPPPLPRSPLPLIEESFEELPDTDIVPASEESKRGLGSFLGAARAQASAAPPPLPPGASMRPAAAPPAVSVAPPPPPPKGGTLRTLPPPPRRDAPAPPPPTIDVENDSDKRKGNREATDDGTIITVGSEAVIPVDASVERTSRTEETRRRASAVSETLALEPAAPPRGWLMPGVAIALLATGAWWVMRTPAPAGESTTPTASAAATATTAATQQPAAVPSTNPASEPSLAPSAMASASASASPSAAPEPKAAGQERRPVGDMQLTLPDVLERAAATRKSGDVAHTRALLERALELSPGNAEALGLLGDLARSQGDNAGAKASYEKALATSPSYYPALMGVADTEWDLGQRDAAQAHYRAIIALGRAVPDRVKERAAQGSSAPAPATASAPPPSAAASVPPAAATASAPAEQ